MAITETRGLLVPGPRVIPRRFGLFSVTGVSNPADPHWQAGAEFEDALCVGVDTTLPVCGVVSPPYNKTPEGGPEFRMTDPFTVYGSYECSTGGRSAQDAFDIARRRLDAWQEYGVESVLWTGTTAAGDVHPSLSDGDGAAFVATDVTPAAGAADAVSAMALLEGALADCTPGAGVIHVPYEAIPALKASALIIREGDSITTTTGQLVVAGAGYPVTGPAADVPAAGEVWIFGTGPVLVLGSDVFLTPDTLAAAVDRSINDVTVYAERTFAVGISCCLIAVLMNISGGA
jgi:hypothetical protein